MVIHGTGSQNNPIVITIIESAEQNDEGCTGTYKYGISENSQALQPAGINPDVDHTASISPRFLFFRFTICGRKVTYGKCAESLFAHSSACEHSTNGNAHRLSDQFRCSLLYDKYLSVIYYRSYSPLMAVWKPWCVIETLA